MPISVASAVIGTYAPAKSGKTTDLLYSFPRGLFIADRAALLPAIGTVGYQLADDQVVPARTLKEAIEVVQKRADSQKYDAVIVDDLSILADYEVAELERKFSGWDVWKVLRKRLIDLRDVARAAGMHVVFTCHEVPPETKDGQFLRGGPKLPQRKTTDQLPALWDSVLRGRTDPNRLGWRGVYHARAFDPEFVTGCRLGTPEVAPMNLREILNAVRLNGEQVYRIRRAPGLDWQEEAVERISKQLLTVPTADWRRLVPDAAGYVRSKFGASNDLHIRWTLRDAIDRAELILARSNALEMFGVGRQ